jgi:hypothetical protein
VKVRSETFALPSESVNDELSLNVLTADLLFIVCYERTYIK